MSMLPPITSAAELPAAIEYANNHPNNRWYVAKMCRSLGQADRVPADWGEAVTAAGLTAAKSMKLGKGGRFAKLKRTFASRGVRDPGALAAFIGRAKYGVKRFAKLGAKARTASGALLAAGAPTADWLRAVREVITDAGVDPEQLESTVGGGFATAYDEQTDPMAYAAKLVDDLYEEIKADNPDLDEYLELLGGDDDTEGDGEEGADTTQADDEGDEPAAPVDQAAAPTNMPVPALAAGGGQVFYIGQPQDPAALMASLRPMIVKEVKDAITAAYAPDDEEDQPLFGGDEGVDEGSEPVDVMGDNADGMPDQAAGPEGDTGDVIPDVGQGDLGGELSGDELDQAKNRLRASFAAAAPPPPNPPGRAVGLRRRAGQPVPPPPGQRSVSAPSTTPLPPSINPPPAPGPGPYKRRPVMAAADMESRLAAARAEGKADAPAEGAILAGHPYPGQRFKHGWIPVAGFNPSAYRHRGSIGASRKGRVEIGHRREGSISKIGHVERHPSGRGFVAHHSYGKGVTTSHHRTEGEARSAIIRGHEKHVGSTTEKATPAPRSESKRFTVKQSKHLGEGAANNHHVQDAETGEVTREDNGRLAYFPNRRAATEFANRRNEQHAAGEAPTPEQSVEAGKKHIEETVDRPRREAAARSLANATRPLAQPPISDQQIAGGAKALRANKGHLGPNALPGHQQRADQALEGMARALEARNPENLRTHSEKLDQVAAHVGENSAGPHRQLAARGLQVSRRLDNENPAGREATPPRPGEGVPEGYKVERDMIPLTPTREAPGSTFHVVTPSGEHLGRGTKTEKGAAELAQQHHTRATEAEASRQKVVADREAKEKARQAFSESIRNKPLPKTPEATNEDRRLMQVASGLGVPSYEKNIKTEDARKIADSTSPHLNDTVKSEARRLLEQRGYEEAAGRLQGQTPEALAGLRDRVAGNDRMTPEQKAGALRYIDEQIGGQPTPSTLEAPTAPAAPRPDTGWTRSQGMAGGYFEHATIGGRRATIRQTANGKWTLSLDGQKQRGAYGSSDAAKRAAQQAVRNKAGLGGESIANKANAPSPGKGSAPQAKPYDTTLRGDVQAYHTTRRPDWSPVPSRAGESGPGVYLSTDKDFAKQMEGFGEGMKSHPVTIHAGDKGLKLLDRTKPGGEEEYRRLQSLNREKHGSLQEGLDKTLAEHGYQGVRNLSSGNQFPETVIHSPEHLSVGRSAPRAS